MSLLSFLSVFQMIEVLGFTQHHLVVVSISVDKIMLSAPTRAPVFSSEQHSFPLAHILAPSIATLHKVFVVQCYVQVWESTSAQCSLCFPRILVLSKILGASITAVCVRSMAQNGQVHTSPGPTSSAPAPRPSPSLPITGFSALRSRADLGSSCRRVKGSQARSIGCVG